MLNWNEVDTVFLDMDGTLLDLHFDNHFWLEHLPRRYGEMRSMTTQEARSYLERYFRDLKGTLNWYCFDYWSDLLNIDLVALKHEVTERIGYRPYAQEFLQALVDGGFRVALVTNSHRAGIEIKMQHTNLSHYISEVYTSHDFGLPKEDVAFWSALSERIHFDPKRTVFFDDNEAVLDSAKQAGIKYLINIAQPDSRGPIREQSDYPLMSSFIDLLPKRRS